ncbi:MAG: helix-turn-helix transcriptional regulator [Synergistaceae bacterium]|nr:helix-turn-helix transcriptional regulator [Synergistaceae bacterium]
MTKIKLFRMERDLKAKDVAKETSIHATVLSAVEAGRIKASDNVRIKLAEFYGVPEEEIFSGRRYAV